MTAAEFDFTIEAGTTYEQSFVFATAYPLYGCTASLIAKTSEDAVGSVLDMSTDNGRIIIAPASSTIAWSLVPSYTSSLVFNTAIYHMYLTSTSGRVDRLLEGVTTLSKKVA